MDTSIRNKYHNYRLYRTTPKLSGNVKWDIILGFVGNTNKLYVRDFHLRPISDRIAYQPDVSENLLIREHQLNIKRFYEETRGSFFSYIIDPNLSSDWPIIIGESEINEADELKYIKNWDDTYWSGAQRMSYSLYETTHELMIPVWLECCSGLKVKFNITGPVEGLNSLRTLELDLSEESAKEINNPFHTKFVKYFQDYLKYIGVWDGCNNVMRVSWGTKETSVRGLEVTSGNIVTRIDNSIVRNLKFRERPLLEQNSILTNVFPDYNMIIPNLINLNFCFNFKSVVTSIIKDSFGDTPSIKISPVVDFYYYNLGLPLKMNELKSKANNYDSIANCTVRDLYTNHEYVMKLGENTNIFDNFLQDNKITDLIHENKIVQPIPHWEAVNSSGTLFNVYRGDIDPVEILENSYDWCTMQYGDGGNVNAIMSNPIKYIEEGVLKDTCGYINGIKFNYQNTGTQENPRTYNTIYVMCMTTDCDTSLGNLEAGSDMHISQPELEELKNYEWGSLAIKTCEYKIKNGEYVNDCQDQTTYDAMSHDERAQRNIYGLYVNYMEIPAYRERSDFASDKDAKDLIIIFWAPSVRVLSPNDEFMGSFNYLKQNNTIRYPQLSINEIRMTLTKYLNNENIQGELDWLSEIQNLFDIVSKGEQQYLIFFNNTVIPTNDNTVSREAGEIELYKSPNYSSYVRRFSANILPSFISCTGNENLRGNQFYMKKVFLSDSLKLKLDTLYVDAEPKPVYRFGTIKSDENLYKYIHTKIRPKYPSLGYDSYISKMKDEKGGKKNIPIDYEYSNNYWECMGMDLRKLPEMKWFDESQICILPDTIEMDLEVKTNDKDALRKATMEKILDKLKSETYSTVFDYCYLDRIYNIIYNLISTEVQLNGSILYKYKFKATLK